MSVCVCVCVCVHACSMCLFVCACACMHTSVCACTYMCVNVRVCVCVKEENDVGEFFLSLDKDPQQDEFLQGRMQGNPYSSTSPGLGPLMRDVKNKICTGEGVCVCVCVCVCVQGMHVTCFLKMQF